MNTKHLPDHEGMLKSSYDVAFAIDSFNQWDPRTAILMQELCEP